MRGSMTRLFYVITSTRGEHGEPSAILRAMRYIIFGAGPSGGSSGARLFQHGHDVVLICRGSHLEAVQREGLRLRTPGESVTLPVPAAGHPSEIDFGPDDVVFLTMKSQHTAAA